MHDRVVPHASDSGVEEFNDTLEHHNEVDNTEDGRSEREAYDPHGDSIKGPTVNSMINAAYAGRIWQPILIFLHVRK